MKIFSKHLFEIRYKPSSHFLDKRGEIAEVLTGSIFNWLIPRQLCCAVTA
jgi:hypothetical protein